MSMLRSKIFIIFFSILTSCRTLDFQQYTDEDFDRKMQELTISYNTKAYIQLEDVLLLIPMTKLRVKEIFKFAKRKEYVD